MAGFSAQDITGLKPRCQLGWDLVWRLWGKTHCQAHSCCWHISVPCGGRTEVTIPCWLWSKDHIQLLEPPHSLPCGSLHLQSKKSLSNPSCALNLWFSLLWPTRENYFYFIFKFLIDFIKWSITHFYIMKMVCKFEYIKPTMTSKISALYSLYFSFISLKFFLLSLNKLLESSLD